MDKSKPAYLLKDVRKLIREENYLLTKVSRSTAHALGFSRTEAGDLISSLTPKDFYKSTTEFYEHTVWQDVYKTSAEGNALYIKFKIAGNGKLLVITSFKEETEGLSQEGR
jgi:motility quorum-sensing regulator/GCU-specific mRNA interferase toxin